MPGKLYIGQPIDIQINVKIDGVKMSTAVSATIEAQKPTRGTVSWPAVIDNVAGTVSYQASPTDIDQAGKWKLQPVVTLAGIPERTFPGESVDLDIAKRFT